MLYLIVTLCVSCVLMISYLYFNNKVKKERMIKELNNKKLYDFYEQEIDKINLTLAGTKNDANIDFEFKDAIKQINLSDFTRIKIYNER